MYSGQISEQRLWHCPHLFTINNPRKERNPMSADIFAKVQEVVADKLDVDASKITPEASFTNDLGADSLDVVELVMALEEEFEVEIPDEEAEKLQTVQSVVDYIKTKVKA
jgi:acyl carrier protein